MLGCYGKEMSSIDSHIGMHLVHSWWPHLGRLLDLKEMEPCWRKYITRDGLWGFIALTHFLFSLTIFLIQMIMWLLWSQVLQQCWNFPFRTIDRINSFLSCFQHLYIFSILANKLYLPPKEATSCPQLPIALQHHSLTYQNAIPYLGCTSG